MKRRDGLDFTLLKLLLATETQSYIKILKWEVGWEQNKMQLGSRVFEFWIRKIFVEW